MQYEIIIYLNMEDKSLFLINENIFVNHPLLFYINLYLNNDELLFLFLLSLFNSYQILHQYSPSCCLYMLFYVYNFNHLIITQLLNIWPPISNLFILKVVKYNFKKGILYLLYRIKWERFFLFWNGQRVFKYYN